MGSRVSSSQSDGDTRISVHQFFTGGWAQDLKLYHHAKEFPDDAAMSDLRGKVDKACVDQYGTIDVEDEMALEKIIMYVHSCSPT